MCQHLAWTEAPVGRGKSPCGQRERQRDQVTGRTGLERRPSVGTGKSGFRTSGISQWEPLARCLSSFSGSILSETNKEAFWGGWVPPRVKEAGRAIVSHAMVGVAEWSHPLLDTQAYQHPVIVTIGPECESEHYCKVCSPSSGFQKALHISQSIIRNLIIFVL